MCTIKFFFSTKRELLNPLYSLTTVTHSYVLFNFCFSAHIMCGGNVLCSESEPRIEKLNLSRFA